MCVRVCVCGTFGPAGAAWFSVSHRTAGAAVLKDVGCRMSSRVGESDHAGRCLFGTAFLEVFKDALNLFALDPITAE